MEPLQPMDAFNQMSMLSPQEEMTLLKRLKEQYDDSMNDVARLHKKVDDWHKLYATYKEESKKEFPWEGASNYRIPLILSVIDSYHARLAKAVFEVDPLWLTRARTPEGVEPAEKAQWYLDYWADEIDLPVKMDKVILSMLIEGTGIAKLEWQRSYTEVHQFGERDMAANPEVNDVNQVVDYDGPNVEVVSVRDFVMIPANSPSIDEAVYVGHKVWRTYQQLKAAERAGVYYNVDELQAKSQGDTHPNYNENSYVKPRDPNTKYEEANQYEIIELYGSYEWDEGVLTPTVFTFSAEHEILLRVEPYSYSYGKPPYIDFVAFPEPNEFYGRSLAGLLESAQEELTTIHNLRMDSIARTVAPPVLKKFGSHWDEEINPLTPKSVIGVNDITDIAELPLRDIPNGLFAHEQDLMAFVERSTGMSDTSMGRMNNQYATATAVNRITSEGLARVDIAVSRFQYGMKRLGWFLWWLLYQYRPLVDYFYAENAQRTITKMDMRPRDELSLMPFELIPQGMLSEASKEARKQQSLMMYQILSAVLSQFYPDGLQKLTDEILKTHDIQDRGSITGPPWSVIQQQIQQAYQQGMMEGMEQGGAEQ